MEPLWSKMFKIYKKSIIITFALALSLLPSAVLALEEMTDIDIALMIDLSEEKIIERLSSRRRCSKCSQPTSLD